MSEIKTKNRPLQSEKTKQLVLAALMAALTYVGTMIIKIPTPTNGYIHPGDGFVLLSGILLGPVWGSLAAGIGSALSDLTGGYFIYVPATFLIKGATALVASVIFKGLAKAFENKKTVIKLVLAGITGELVMVTGYFVFEIFMLTAGENSGLAAGVVAAAAGIIPNIIQGLFGVVISATLYPLIRRLYE
jgi:uncharacterized membrane protein